ncbi:EAL domain-containing protein [Zooshikella sp. RANM57]|uniref:EAL domain-containing protein n=1 Tax=Zooshikella sp. RANM57 TaxID=3425863 RepID=UPI003D6DD07A
MNTSNILVVEDEKVVALDIKRRLIRLGYNVTGMASSAVHAERLIIKTLPDLVLMDIHIQGDTDGIELASVLQKRYHIPVIYLTAYSEEKTIARASETKPYGYLLKPFSERELHVAIQVAIERFKSDHSLRKSETHLRLALEAANLATWETNPNICEVYFTKNTQGVLSPVESWNELLEKIHREDKSKVLKSINLLRQQHEQRMEFEFRVVDTLSHLRWFKLYGKSFCIENTDEVQVVGVIQDITQLKETEEQLSSAAIVFQSTAEGIAILNTSKKVDSINNAFTVITGFDQEDLLDKELPILSKINLGNTRYQTIWQHVSQERYWQGEITTFRHNEQLVYMWVNISTVTNANGSISKFIVVISDISAMREAQEKLSYIAYFDGLTDLPNRTLLMNRLEQELKRSKRYKQKLALLFIDLDHFKRINDTLGHQVGDKMLRAVAKRLKSVLRDSDIVGRLGGDEFIVIMSNLPKDEDAAILSKKILKTLTEPMLLSNTEIIPSCSIGISLYPKDSNKQDSLIQMADTAMYAAKEKGRNNYSFYSPEMTEYAVHYLTRENELRKAVQKNEFKLFFQPQVDTNTGKLIGLESLIRWETEKHGLMPASEIIPIAESSHLIISVGNWVLTETCRQIRAWLDQGIPLLRVAVNISIRQLTDGKLPQFISELLKKYRLPPDCLELEVTESCLQDDDMCLLTLRKINGLGITISIDDFGTGYSCMGSLKQLPIQRLKIDQIFVKDIPKQDDDCAIVSAIIALGHQLHLRVIAEGVETLEQYNYLKNIHCDELQGYYFCIPMNAQDTEEYLLSAVKNNKFEPLK